MWGQGAFKHRRALVWKSKFVTLLSGTPVPNRPFELYPMLTALCHEVIDFMGKDEFGKRFCNGRFDLATRSYIYDGSSNENQLNEMLTEKFMFVVSKETVKKELPPLKESMVLVGGNEPPEIKELERLVRRKYHDDLNGILNSLEEDTHITTLRRLVGEYKVGLVLPEIVKSLEAHPNDKFIIFAVHKEVMEKLQDALMLYGVEKIDGSVPMKKRAAIIKAWRTDPTRQVLLGNLTALGEGHTIVEANHVDFVEYSWTPKDNRQAADRAHRIGQTLNVSARFFILRNTLDVDMMNANDKKSKSIDQIIKERKL
jgi:SNF2 family DNA or RNA helicase